MFRQRPVYLQASTLPRISRCCYANGERPTNCAPPDLTARASSTRAIIRSLRRSAWADLITAIGAGTTAIRATSGRNAALVTVLVGQNGPETVIVPSEDVVSVDDSQAILIADARTTAIRPGQIVVSGDRGGLLATVVAARQQGSRIMLHTGQASLAEAFPNTHADIYGAASTAILRLNHGVGSITFEDGRTYPLSSSGFKCTSNGKATNAVSLTGATVRATVDVTVVTHLVFLTKGGDVSNFLLAVKIDGKVVGSSGSVALNVAGKYDFDCSITGPTKDLPAFKYGPLFFDLDFATEYGVQGSIGSTATEILAGPTATASFSGEEGIQYKNDTWSQINTGNPDGKIKLTPASVTIAADVKADLKPYAEADLAADVSLAHKVHVGIRNAAGGTAGVSGDISAARGTAGAGKRCGGASEGQRRAVHPVARSVSGTTEQSDEDLAAAWGAETDAETPATNVQPARELNQSKSTTC